jgi:hypothetical protein
LCWSHHRAVHEGGFRVERLPGDEFQFYAPDGKALPDVPEAPILLDDPVLSLRSHHQEEGIHIDEYTCCPDWDGEPMDLEYVMSVLLN